MRDEVSLEQWCSFLFFNVYYILVSEPAFAAYLPLIPSILHHKAFEPEKHRYKSMKTKPRNKTPLHITPPVLKSNSLLFSPRTIRNQRRFHVAIASRRSKACKAKTTQTKPRTPISTTHETAFVLNPCSLLHSHVITPPRPKPPHLQPLDKPLPARPRSLPYAPSTPNAKLTSLNLRQRDLEARLQQYETWIEKFKAGYGPQKIAPNGTQSQGMRGRVTERQEDDSFAPDYLLKPTVYNPAAERKKRDWEKEAKTEADERQQGSYYSKSLKVPKSIGHAYQKTALALAIVEMEIELLCWAVWDREGWGTVESEKGRRGGGGLGRMGTVQVK